MKRWKLIKGITVVMVVWFNERHQVIFRGYEKLKFCGKAPTN